MNVRIGLLASASLFLIMGAGEAIAADLLPPPPPQIEVVDPGYSSCLYARVDGGYDFNERPKVSKVHTSAGAGWASGSSDALGEKRKNTGFIEGGLGCEFANGLRAEVTGGYHFKRSLSTVYGDLDADLESYTIFANVFWDITNYGGFTPYVGGGLGAAINTLSNVNLPATSGGGTDTVFAWNVGVGVSYDFTPNLKLDVGYRYVDLGKVTGSGPDPMTVDNINAHEVKVGMRYHFGTW